MKILKIILISTVSLVLLYLLGIFIYGIFFGNKIDWTQESRRKLWDTYKNQELGFSFEYPPPVSVKEENKSESVIENTKLLLSLSVRDDVWGTIYVLPVTQSTRSPNYARNETIIVNGNSVIIAEKAVEKEINLTNDRTKTANIATEVILPNNPDLKLCFVITFKLTDDIETRKLKEKYFDHMVASLRFQ